MKWFITPRELRRLGIVGMNQRNTGMIARLNHRRNYPLVDDKLLTKKLAFDAGIAVPELCGVIETNHDARHLPDLIAGHEDFVIKPAHGSGGNGILVITGRMGERFRKASGLLEEIDGLEHHVSNILSGMYSLGGQSDKAMIAYRAKFDPLFADVSFQGVPDIRADPGVERASRPCGTHCQRRRSQHTHRPHRRPEAEESPEPRRAGRFRAGIDGSRTKWATAGLTRLALSWARALFHRGPDHRRGLRVIDVVAVHVVTLTT